MKGQYINLTSDDGRTFGAYLAKPASAKAPGIVLMQEIFGVNASMREVADSLAAAGFLVVAPDLFWRQRPRVELDSNTEEGRAVAMGLLKQLDTDLAVKDCIAAENHLRAMPECNSKVGAVGYCLGGKLAYLMATRSRVDASVGYYGIGIQDLLGEAPNIRKPLMLHIAGKDHLCPPEAQKTIADSLAALGALAKVHVYPDAGHAFARRGSPTYREDSAQPADRRTIEFLSQQLALG